MERFLTVGEVAEIFNVTDYTVRVWLKSGKLNGFKPAGQQWRITQSEVVAFANKQYGESSATN
jgi:excisionase family DNA binding protein